MILSILAAAAAGQELIAAPRIRITGDEQLTPDGRWLIQEDLHERAIAIPLPGNPAAPLAIAADGEEVDVFATADAIYVSREAAIEVRDPGTLAVRSTLPPTPHPARVIAAAGPTVVAAGQHGEGLLVLGDAGWRAVPDSRGVPPAALSPDGTRLLTCGTDYGPLTVTGREIADGSVAFEAVSDLEAGHCARLLPGPDGRVWAVGSEGLVAVAPGTGTADAAIPLPEGFQISDAGASSRFVYGQDEKRALVVRVSLADGSFETMDVATRGPVLASADDRRLLVQADGDRLVVVDPRRGRVLADDPDDANLAYRNAGCVWWADATHPRVLDEAGVLHEWDLATGERTDRQLPFTHMMRCEARGDTIFVDASPPLVWDAGRVVRFPELHGGTLSADGRTLLGTAVGGFLVGDPHGTLRRVPGPMFGIAALSPDGRKVVGYDGPELVVVDLDGGGERRFPASRYDEFAWAPDSRAVYRIDASKLVRLDIGTGAVEELGAVPDEVRFSLGMLVLDDGRVMVTQGDAYAVWSPADGFRAAAPTRLGEDCQTAPSPDGTRVVTACRGGTVWIRPLAP